MLDTETRQQGSRAPKAELALSCWADWPPFQPGARRGSLYSYWLACIRTYLPRCKGPRRLTTMRWDGRMHGWMDGCDKITTTATPAADGLQAAQQSERSQSQKEATPSFLPSSGVSGLFAFLAEDWRAHGEAAPVAFHPLSLQCDDGEPYG